jgi:hypothetical protein
VRSVRLWDGRYGTSNRKEKYMSSAYKWKTGFRGSVKPSVAGKVFEELEQTVGLTPQNLVDASRSEDAPMHKCFEWDDAVAGEEWRKQQARVCINHLEIIIDDKEAPATRAFVQYEANDAKYEHILTVLSDPEKSNSFFELGMKMLNDFKKRFADVKEFASVIAEIEKIA